MKKTRKMFGKRNEVKEGTPLPIPNSLRVFLLVLR